jgi:quercetin dioxygenase-like cupin family protein
MPRTRSALACLLTALVLAVAGCGSSSSDPPGDPSAAAPAASTTVDGTASSPTTTVAVRTEVLDDLVDPPGAHGRTLSLVRYHIAPGAKLAAHVHPGVQMARIESGTLTYTVVSGTALVRRAGDDTDTGVTGPTTITLRVGDSVIERGDMVHYGENRADEPLVITATLLTEDGHDLAEPVTTTPASD